MLWFSVFHPSQVSSGNSHPRSLFLKYEIFDDKVRIQSILPFYRFDISYDNIEKVEIGSPPVFWDKIKKGYYSAKYGFGFRILKNDLADLSRHVTIEKRNGCWKQIRITPENPEESYRTLISAIQEHKK